MLLVPKLHELTSKVSASTKSAISKTNEAVKTAVSNKARADDHGEKKKQRKQRKTFQPRE